MAKAVVCEDCTLIGDITISPGCVIQTSATIIAEAGPIILGENCIVEEYASIIYRNATPREDASTSPTATAVTELPVLSIGPQNVFEVGCTVEALKIGEKNLFESKCYVGSGVTVSNGCIIGAGVRLMDRQELPENTVIYKNTGYQREAIEKQKSHIMQIDFLRKVLPNYHHLRKPNTTDTKKLRLRMI